MKKEKKEIIEWLKDNHYEEDLPWYFSAYKMSDLLYGLWYDFYLETLGTNGGEWEELLYLDYYEPIVDAVIMMDEQPREYHFETLEEIADQVLKFEEIYKHFKEKFYKLTNYNHEKDHN